MYNKDNNVRLAIDRAGGPTKISNLFNVSNGSVHNWIKTQRVPNIDHARQLASIAGMSVEQVRPVPEATSVEKCNIFPVIIIQSDMVECLNKFHIRLSPDFSQINRNDILCFENISGKKLGVL